MSKVTVFLYPWKIFFPTGLCLFPGPTTPGCIKVRFQNFPNFGEFIDLFTVPRDGGRKASQRSGGSQDCQKTVWATWLPKFTAGGLRMRNCVEETSVEASGWPGFFRMRKRARKKKSNFVPSLTDVWKQRRLTLSNETVPFIDTRFLKVHWVAPYEKTLIVNSYYKNVSSLIKLSEMHFFEFICHQETWEIAVFCAYFGLDCFEILTICLVCINQAKHILFCSAGFELSQLFHYLFRWSLSLPSTQRETVNVVTIKPAWHTGSCDACAGPGCSDLANSLWWTRAQWSG